ncbi:MAG: ParA family protein [Asgard group archaeon]|nr:ParA family protein [Asgard group archaeon]
MKVIVFHSYKGGTGKTTVALNVAMTLAQKGYRVLAIDADLNAPTFESIFVGLKPKFSFNDLFEYELRKKEDEKSKPPKPEDLPVNSRLHDNLDLIFANSKPKFGEGLLSMDKTFHTNALKKLLATKIDFEKLGYDYVIMDTSPSINLASINSIIIADATVIVLRPNKYGIAGTTFLLKELYSMLGIVKRKDYIVFNQVVPGTPSKLINQWKKHFKKRLEVETIGILHCNCSIALNMLFGKMIIDQEDTEFPNIINSMVEKIHNDLTEQKKE